MFMFTHIFHVNFEKIQNREFHWKWLLDFQSMAYTTYSFIIRLLIDSIFRGSDRTQNENVLSSFSKRHCSKVHTIFFCSFFFLFNSIRYKFIYAKSSHDECCMFDTHSIEFHTDIQHIAADISISIQSYCCYRISISSYKCLNAAAAAAAAVWNRIDWSAM